MSKNSGFPIYRGISAAFAVVVGARGVADKKAQGTEWGTVLAWWFAGRLVPYRSGPLYDYGNSLCSSRIGGFALVRCVLEVFGKFFVVALVVLAAAMQVLHLRVVRTGGL